MPGPVKQNIPNIFGASREDPSIHFRKRLVENGLIQASWFGRIQHPNGKDLKITVRQVWELYLRDHLPTVSESTRVNKEFRCSKFLPPMFDIRMCELTPQMISEFVRFNIEQANAKPSTRRFNFQKELKDFKSIASWYADTIDFQFVNPIKPQHYKLAIVREIPRREREISVAQFKLFLSHLPERYRDICVAQYLGACRIGEIAGLQWKNIDFDRRIVTIREIIVWVKGQPRVKLCPKNGKSRQVYLSEAMLEILRKRLLQREGSAFVFHNKGKPLLYSVINANFNRAWKKAGLTQFHGTHQTRFFAAQRARILSGSIDGVKALTGQSIQMAQKYSDYSCVDQTRATIEKMEVALLGEKLSA